jgi:glycerophosphoryl diester phosphodiesterase
MAPPRNPRTLHPYLHHDGPIAFAHRGGAGEWPENTMPAFEGAVALGYRYLETDVQVTADGVLAAFHDDDLSRTCGRAGTISSLPWSEVAAARVDGREPIPLLVDLLEAFPDARLNIDCKSDAAVEPLVTVLRRTNALDRVCLGTFSHRRMQRLRSLLGDELCTAGSPIEVGRWISRTPLARLRMPHAMQVPVRQGKVPIVSRKAVEIAHSIGMHVHVWTIDDPTEMHRLLDLGVDGIMTDRPAVLKQVLESRGQWA